MPPVHWLAVQVCPGAHALSHAPQCCAFVLRFTQDPAHKVPPVGQRHEPATHSVPPVHFTPQLPQLSGSLKRLTQAPPHEVSPLQSALHAPP
jgi:hypothetical protein